MSTPIVVVGTTTKDPDLRYSADQLPICRFPVAVNERKKNASGQWEDGETTFFEVTCFGTLAENVAESIPKGARVVATGKFRLRKWQGRDGQYRTTAEVTADEVAPSLRWTTASVQRQGRSAAPGRPAPTADGDAAFAPDDDPFG